MIDRDLLMRCAAPYDVEVSVVSALLVMSSSVMSLLSLKSSLIVLLVIWLIGHRWQGDAALAGVIHWRRLYIQGYRRLLFL